MKATNICYVNSICGQLFGFEDLRGENFLDTHANVHGHPESN